MRRFVAVIAALVGLVGSVAGGAAAVLVGSDDIVSTRATAVAGGAAVAVSRPALLDYDGWTMRVTATNAAGPVFVGVGHPVDVRDYVAGVEHAEVVAVGPTGVRTQVVEGKAPAPSPDPTTLDLWTAHASGRGSQHLDLDLRAEPLLLYAGPVGEAAGPLTLSVGVRIPHLFVAAIAATALGLGLVAVGVLLWRRTRRSGPRVDAPGGAATPAVEGERTGGGGSGRVVGAAFVLSVALGGCGALPQRAGSDLSSWDSRPALTRAELAGVWQTYDRDNNAAIRAASAPTYDPKPWAKVDTGAALLGDRFTTAYAKAKGDRSTPPRISHTPVGLHAATVSGYPMAVLTTSRVRSSDPQDQPPADVVRVASLVRPRASSGWRLSSVVSVKKELLPRELPVGAPTTPSAADLVRARAAATAVRNYLNYGSGISVSGSIATWRADVARRARDEGYAQVAGSAEFLGRPSDPMAPGGPVQVVRVEGGLLALAAYQAVDERSVAEGYTLSFGDATTGRLLGQPGSRSSLRSDIVFVALISIPDQGAASVIASRDSLVLKAP